MLNLCCAAHGNSFIRVQGRFGQGYIAVGHECDRPMAQPSSLPCIGDEFKTDPVKAPGATRGLDGAAVV